MWPYPWTHVGIPSPLGHMDRVAATMPSQAHAGAAQEAPDIGQWEKQDVPLVRPSSCTVKGGKDTYLPTFTVPAAVHHMSIPNSYFLVHGGCPPASITQKRPNHGQVSVHGEPKFIEGQQPYVQYLRGCDPAPKCTKGLVTVGCGFAIGPVVGVMTRDESKIKGTLYIFIYIYIYRNSGQRSSGVP